MRSFFPIAALIILLVVGGAGCASSGSTVPGLAEATPDRIYESVAAQHRRITTMEGTGSISVQTPDVAQSGSFELLLQKPDSLLIKLEGPFGIDVGTALVSRQEFQFYDVLRNRLIIGATTPENLERVFRMAVNFDDLLALVAGGAFLGTDDPGRATLERADDAYLLTFEGHPVTRQYYIDPVTLLITNIVFLRSNGTVVAEQRFTDFRSVDGVVIPFEVKVIQRSERRMVAVRYSEVTINKRSSELHFSVPANTRKVYLQ